MESQEEKPMTFEDLVALDKQLKSTNLATVGAAGASEDITSKLKTACSIFKVIRPVIGVILGIPFIPGSVKDALKRFRSVMDSVCV